MQRSRLLPASTAALACLAAVPAVYLAVSNREFFHLEAGLSLWGVAGVAAMIAAAVLVLRHPSAGLFILVAFVFLNLSQILVRFHDLPSLLQLLGIPMFVSACTARYLMERKELGHGALTLALVLYNVVLFGSTVIAREPGLADERWTENLKALVVYLLVAGLVSSLRDVRRGVKVLLGAGALLSALAAFQALTGSFALEYGGLARIKYAQIYGDVFEPRIAGPLGDPNFFAQILLLLVPLALYTAWAEKSLLSRAAAYGVAALVGTAIVLSYSRGAAFALAVGLGLILLERRIRMRTVLVLAAVAVVGYTLLPAGFTRRLVTIEEFLPGSKEVIHPDASFAKRRLLTAVAWRVFLDHPLAGVGAGNYTKHYDAYADEVGSASREYEVAEDRHFPHNLYLEIAAETGLIGLSVFGLMAGVTFLYLYRARSVFLCLGEAAGAGLATAFAIGLVSYLVSSLFLHGHFQRYLYLVFAFATALHNLSEARVPGEAHDRQVAP